jgi:hypothetical protein
MNGVATCSFALRARAQAGPRRRREPLILCLRALLWPARVRSQR